LIADLRQLAHGNWKPLLGDIGVLLKNVGEPFNGGELYMEQDFGEHDGYFRYEAGGVTEYRRVAGSNTVTIDTNYEIDAIECTILGFDEVEACQLTIRTDEDKSEETSVEVVNGTWNGRQTHPIRLEFDPTGAPVTISLFSGTDVPLQARDITDRGWQRKQAPTPLLSVPTARSNDLPDFPIILVSIDSLRYNHLRHFESIIERLDAEVPPEPRTQGAATWQSHASLFTSVHPYEHNCHVAPARIPDDLVTLPEFLSERGFRCSALVSNRNLSPEIGFGRGFHRYEHREMDWRERTQDARTSVAKMIDWIEEDAANDDCRGFYFLHLNDIHYPYYPPPGRIPATSIDYDVMQTLIDAYDKTQDYLALVRDDTLDVDPEVIELARQYYDLATEYVASQLERLVDALDRIGVFDECLVILVGDHGEEFGENGTLFHRSLYDANIRPAMFVKFPESANLTLPAEPDFIDVFPTIAELLDAEPSDQCVGQAWTEDYASEARLTEAFLDRYLTSIEIDGWKAIFTYEDNGSDRPSSSQLKTGPVYEEFFRMPPASNERESPRETCPPETRSTLLNLVHEFIESGQRSDVAGVELEPDVEARLAELGYRDR